MVFRQRRWLGYDAPRLLVKADLARGASEGNFHFTGQAAV